MKRITLLFAFLVMSIGWAAAQSQVEVSGTVISAEDNQPIIGAAVRGKVSKQGAQTNIDGKFKFNVPASEKVLVVSFMGMKTREVAVGKDLRIVLQPDESLLEEVVVIGYGSGRAVTKTSASIVKVSSKEIAEKPTANAFDALQGKVAGLQVYTSSGEPSAVSSIKLHGVGSLGASSAPLYILDGMPVTQGTIMAMNPNDFESYQILKDAAATSIYGARAANGVIFITTKRGKVADRANITVRGQYGVSNLANPDYFENLMSTNELFALWTETGAVSAATIENYKKNYGHNNFKWYKYYLHQNVPTSQGDVTISGGAGRTNYYVSLGTMSQEGIREGSDYKKFNARANISSELNPFVRFGFNNSITYDITNVSPYAGNSTGGGGLAMLAPPFYTPYDENGKEYEVTIPGWGRMTPKYFTSKISDERTAFTLSSLGNVVITPFEGMTIKSQAGLELMDYKNDYLRKPSMQGANLGNGQNWQGFSRTMTWSTNTTAEYKFAIDKNSFSAMLGHEYIDYDYNSFYASGTGLEDDRLVQLTHTTKDKEVGAIDGVPVSQYAFLSYFGAFSYDYDSKYFVDVVLRNDASSRFGKNKQNGTFWSLGLMWKAKKETFLEDLKWLNALDVKFSIGTQGNAGIGNYDTYATAGKVSQYGGKVGWGLLNAGNDDLTWENQRKITLGLNFRVFDRIGVNLEVYDRLTTDMLMDVPLPYTTGIPVDQYGFSSQTMNVGSYLNRGIDLRIDADILKGRDYQLNGYFNFNYNRDKVVELFQGRDAWELPGYGFAYVVGEPVTFFYPIFKEINPENGYPVWYLPGEDSNRTHKDDSQVTSTFNSAALTQNTGIRRNTPMTGGLGLSGSYKGFYFQSDFAFALGKKMISNDRFFFENPYAFAGYNQSKNASNFWRKAGDKALHPGLEYTTTLSPSKRFLQFDSRLIEDASFLRLKTLTVGYNVPENIIKKQSILTGAKLYVTARNLLTFTKYRGVDPEIDSNLSLGNYPNSKQFTVGMEIQF